MWQRIIDGQYRRPSGLLGRWVGRKMAQQHVPENGWTVALLGAQPTDHILEVGFGPGLALEALSKIVTQGFIAGVDVSHTMVSAARKRNAAAIREGRMDLQYGEASRLPCANASFDKAYSIHSVYFWPHPATALRELCRVLKPQGTLTLTILPKSKWGTDDPNKPLGTPECKPYSGEELKDLLLKIGFSSVRIAADTTPGASPSNYSVIATK
jgi:ubiquinone/menaquinone biosynthesis C-methylase UbiE